jgi:hypothetical protein
MAAPSSPTLVSITTEGLNRAGYDTFSSAFFTRAKGWSEEVKNDIWRESKRLRLKLQPLQITKVSITTEGVNRYALPTDFDRDLTLAIYDGADTGTAQAGASGTITLAADEDITEANLKQKIGILIYAGTGKNSFSQVTAYNTTTKVATVSPNFNTSPANGDSYMFVDTIYPVDDDSIVDYDKSRFTSSSVGRPDTLYPLGDNDNGEFIVDPKPYRSSGVPWGMRLRYYTNLMEIDLSSTLMSTLYQRWRNLFVTGVKYRALEENDDARAKGAEAEYTAKLISTIEADSYELDYGQGDASFIIED